MDKKRDLVRFFFLNFPLEIILILFIIPGMLFSPRLLPFLIIYFIFIIGIVILSHLLFMKTNRSFYKFLVLDLTHIIFLAAIIFVPIAGMGRVSQAVVEGVAGNIFYGYKQYAIYAIYVLLFAQIFIIPWSLFCNFLIRKTMNVKITKVIFLSLVGIVIVYVLLMSGCRILLMRVFKPNAKHMYQHYFSTPINKIQKLRSGGTAWLDNPVCIKFQSKEAIFLKDQNLYSPADIAEPRRFFLMEYPYDKKILDDSANLVCISYAEKQQIVDNWPYTLLHWLLYNKKTGNYYFLIKQRHQL